MQIKLLVGTDYRDLENQINTFLESISADDAKVDMDFANIAAVVTYGTKPVKAICVECKFYDEDDSSDGLYGLCQRCGKRVRFNSKPCKHFLDVRG